MPGPLRTFLGIGSIALIVIAAACSSSPRATQPVAPIRPTNAAAGASPATDARRDDAEFPVMLGIDVLAAQNFAPLAGKRVGLLTHPAGVNRYGVSTVDVLRRASNVKLVALFGPEHGIYGTTPASENIPDLIDRRTGLPAYSLYGKNRKPTKEQLHGIDVLVIDLQDIGVRSYTFNVCMRYAIEACFENGVEVMVLDRPNPLGGLKVDGPILDREWVSGVGAYPIPYVHGLTMGELARMAVATPGVLEVSEHIRSRGRLTVVPMRGWRRAMRWPETGLAFTPTSPMIRDFAACVGYAMTGLGTQIGGFKHGLGNHYPFRGLSCVGRSAEQLQHDLQSLRIPGLAFRRVSATNRKGEPVDGVYIEVADWDAWRPTELSFYLMRLTCQLSGTNPFAAATAAQARSFNIHTGSTAWWNALSRQGAHVDVAGFIRLWQQQALAYQQQTRPFWLYE